MQRFTKGKNKLYELNDHLENVRVVISDRKLLHVLNTKRYCKKLHSITPLDFINESTYFYS